VARIQRSCSSMNTRIALLAGAILIIGTPAQSQTDRSQSTIPSADDPLVRTLSRLDPNTRVRVRTGPTIIEGDYTGFSDQGVLLRNAPDASAIPFSSIDEMWKRSRSTLRGAIVGGAFGAVLVGTFGVLLVQGLCESSDGCSNDYPTAALFGGAIGAAGGGILGAGIGALVKRWQRIHP
jgi:hypothetical protein